VSGRHLPQPLCSAALLLWVANLAACNPFASLEPPSRKPDIAGIITEAEARPGGLRILIEEKPGVWAREREVEGAKMYLDVTRSTSILVQQPDRSWRKGRETDLRIGASVAAWTTGVILETYPPLGVAAEIAVLALTPQ
jgi:hypothetical protein